MTGPEESYFVSRSGTKHIVGPPSSKLQGGRISALCGFTRLEDIPFETLPDCMLCEKETAEARRKATEAEERERIRNGPVEARIEPEQSLN
jgi:hypothetical protein